MLLFKWCWAKRGWDSVDKVNQHYPIAIHSPKHILMPSVMGALEVAYRTFSETFLLFWFYSSFHLWSWLNERIRTFCSKFTALTVRQQRAAVQGKRYEMFTSFLRFQSDSLLKTGHLASSLPPSGPVVLFLPSGLGPFFLFSTTYHL